MTAALYERLGQTYHQARRPDPRIADQIATAIGDPQTVINVGAGTGSYEPTGCCRRRWETDPPSPVEI